MVKCPECGKALRVRKNQEYRYRESGLDNVILTGIRVLACSGCREVFPEIPNIVGLHRAIASHLARKPALLTGPEFRFLRKEMGLKAKDLAKDLGTTDVTISRWETGNKKINPAADRLLRLLYSLHTVQAGRAVEPAKFVHAFLEGLKEIVPGRRPRPLSLRLPVSGVKEREWAAA
jgi:putative zinc finger/helix-turn-helix YgiT family protein